MGHKLRLRSLKKKVFDYAKSEDGKNKMADRINDYIDGGTHETAARSSIVTKSDMEKVAQLMIATLKKHSDGLPESVKAHFNSLKASSPKKLPKNGGYSVGVYFDDDLSRPSLLIIHGKNKGKRTGEGVFNIVALFDEGYSAHKRVFGVWERENDEVYTGSRINREGLSFMQKAVTEFNSDYGKQYNVYAQINPEFYGISDENDEQT